MLRNRKKNNRQLFNGKILLIASLIGLIFLSISLSKEIINRRHIKAQMDTLDSRIALFEVENSQLSALINDWHSGNQIEKEARIKLGLKKPDEKVILITKDEDGGGKELSGDSLKLDPPPDKPMSNYVKWWLYFFNQQEK